MAKITITTFGFGFGAIGDGYAHIADVRNVPSFRNNTPDATGNDKEVHDQIMGTKQAQAWLKKMENWSIKDGDKVAIGCSRGHHRSVSIARDYASYLRQNGWDVTLTHRDIAKKYSWVESVVNKINS